MSSIQSILRKLIYFLVLLLPARLRSLFLLWPYRAAHAKQLACAEHPHRNQRETLQQIIDRNRQTEFGRAHAFDRISDPEAFAARVPLRTFEELEPYILRQHQGEADVLLSSTLVGFALSARAHGRPRPIPVTRAILDQWGLAEQLLMRLAIENYPQVVRGRALHLLPHFQLPAASQGLPLLPLSVIAAMEGAPAPLPNVVPWQIFSVEDETIRFYLILRLSVGQPITLLRAAAPGTLTILAKHMDALGPKLVQDIEAGEIAYLDEIPEGVRQEIPRLPPNPTLASRLRRVLEQNQHLRPAEVWPELQLLVCSKTGHSRSSAKRLVDRFGNLPLLDPGYRAAEGIITWPWLDQEGGQIVLEGHYLEFLLAEGDGAPIPLQELKSGRKINIVITGFNGLYRTVLHDMMEVIQVGGGLPCLALIGRSKERIRLGKGELKEEVVSEAIMDAARHRDLMLTGFTSWMQHPPQAPAAPESDEAPAKRNWLSRLLRRAPTADAPEAIPLLVVVVEPDQPLEESLAQKLLSTLDKELRSKSEAYDTMRGSGEMSPPTIMVLRSGTLARRVHQRLADGVADAHAPIPALSDNCWSFDAQEVTTQIPPVTK